MKRTIKNIERYDQRLLFAGLENKKCSYTDIDFIQEIDNHTLIVGENKVKGTKLTIGQQILIERLCDKQWKHSFGVVVEHEVPAGEDVYLIDTIVRKIYVDNVWRDYRDKNITYGEFINTLREKLKVKKL